MLAYTASVRNFPWWKEDKPAGHLMIDILLINPSANLEASGGTLKEFLVPMPPINLAYLASALEEKKFSVAIYDDFLNKGNDEKVLECIKLHNPNFVGFPTYTCSLMYRVYQLSALIRKHLPETKIVLGNIHASVFYEEILRAKIADYIVIGEGERTLPLLLDSVIGKHEIKDIDGVAYFDGQHVIKNQSRCFVDNLDLLPFPAWHLLPIESYNTFFFAKVKKKSLLISGSRGCPYRCSFCSLFTQGDRRRARSINNIVDEIEYFNSKYGVEQFSFVDPVFPWGTKEGVAFCDEIIRRGLDKKIVWVTETRVDLIDAYLAKRMHQAGCRMIMFGIESAHQDDLDLSQKKFKLETVRSAIKFCQDAKINTTGFFIVGFPNETPKRILNTLKWAIRTGVTFAKFNVFVPYPGTQLYADLQRNGGLDQDRVTDWNCYTSYPSLKNYPVVKYSHLSVKMLIFLQYYITFRFYLRAGPMVQLLRVLTFKDYMIFIKHFFALITSPAVRILGRFQ